jgi:NAD-dependent SIR2 family protein deacetylase
MSDARAYQALRICLMNRLWLADVWGTAEMTGWLQNIESSKDILITTNYDTLLERAIHRLRFKQGLHRKDMGLLDYGVPGEFLAPGYERLAYTMSPDAILLLKLHGSISWSYCNNCKKAELDPTYMGQASNALSGADHCPTCGLSLSPILVGPGHKKYNHPIINEIRAVACNMLSQANEVVFVGFSLNQNDHQVYQLLAASHKIAKTESVMLVDPRADLLLPIYQTIYGDVVTCHPQNSWKEYLDAIFPRPPKVVRG